MDTTKFRTRTSYRKLDAKECESKWIIALDIGYSGVKIYSPKVAASFPAYAKRDGRQYLGEPEKTMITYRDLDNGELWSVGQDAENSIDDRDTGDSEEALYGRDRYASSMFRVLVETGLGIGAVGNGACGTEKEIYVQTGLPPKYKKRDSEYLKDIIAGKHRFAVKTGANKEHVFEFEIKRENIDVMDQPMGTLFSVMTGADGEFVPNAGEYFTKNVIIFDPGFGTLDIFPVRNHKISNSETFDNLGMKRVLKETVNRINSDYGQDISVAAMQKYLERGTFRCTTRKNGRMYSEDIRFDEILEQANEKVCEEALRQLEQVIPIEEFDYLIITGGTSAAWREMIHDHFSGMQTLKIIDGNMNGGLGYIFANVRGYFMYRRSMVLREEAER